jgi:predicted transcriptional regulator
MSSDEKNEEKGWEGAKGHRFALEVLQLRLGRKMLSLIAGCMRSNEQMEKELDLRPALAEYHLQMLEKALVIERAQGCWRITPTGSLYLEKVEARR